MLDVKSAAVTVIIAGVLTDRSLPIWKIIGILLFVVIVIAIAIVIAIVGTSSGACSWDYEFFCMFFICTYMALRTRVDPSVSVDAVVAVLAHC